MSDTKIIDAVQDEWIERYGLHEGSLSDGQEVINKRSDGDYVLYSDHVRLIAAARKGE